MKKTVGRAAIGLMCTFALLHGDETSDPRLLDFTVVAVDGQGRPVSGLTSADFQVVDEGKRQQISFFHQFDDKQLLTPAPVAGEVSNRNPGSNQRVTLVLFDLLNEHFDTRAITSNQIVKDLQRIEAPNGLYLYMLTLEGRIFAVHGLSGPGEVAKPDAAPWTKGIKPLLDGAMNAVLRARPVDIDVNVRVQMTLNALDAIAAQLSVFPGRKSIVWVTDGIPLALTPNRSDTGDFVDYTPALRQLSDAFDRSGTAIYPVQQIMMGSQDGFSGGGIESKAALDEISGLTGGRPTSGKDVGAAVARAMGDSEATYRIGYYASPKTWDSKFHKLRITCTRKGVKIQARTGYYAYPEPVNSRAQRAVDSALASTADAAEIGLAGTATPDPQAPDQVHLALRVDANDVALAQDGDAYSGQLRLVLAGYQPDGRVSNSPLIPFDLHYNAAERDHSLKEGIPFAQDVKIGKDVSKVRMVVFDRGSNAVGSLTIPIQARPAAK